jgi:spore coat polysaccharide biosynthesis protein SpsF
MSVGILITVRLKSTRLPRKALRELCGRPLISHLIDRLRLSTHAEHLVLCTSDDPQDDPLIDIARASGIAHFRGHPDDVLQRLTDAATAFDFDTVVSCTGDNPFVDPIWADRLVEFHRQQGADHCRLDGLPWGTFCYTLQRTAMQRACAMKAETDTEVWGGYFTETGDFTVRTLDVNDETVRRPHYRLTVDTPDDFAMIDTIFNALYTPGEVFSLARIVSFLDTHPDVAAMNAHVQQKAGRAIRVRADAGR